MLSRTADNLYWLARYMERAENLARLLEVSDRIALMPSVDDSFESSEWQSALTISGSEPQFAEMGQPVEASNVINFIARDTDNPSSIFSCLKLARDNGRAVRNAITTDMWESLNGTWLELEQHWNLSRSRGQIRPFLDWVRERSSLFRGATSATMLRDESYHFTRLGTHIERADNTARILDVKYHVLLPDSAEVGGGIDYLQWTTILRAFSALGSYHWLYREHPKPWRIAEMMILRPEMPRSLISCLKEIDEHLSAIAVAHGRSRECHRMVGKLYSQLRFSNSDEIFANGLHEFLSGFIASNNRLANQISNDYLILN